MMRHLRFRMRTIFALVTLSAVGAALSATQAQRQRAAVAEIRRLGGQVLYEAAAYDSEVLRLVPWLAGALGPDWFHSVDGVHMPRATDDSIVLLQALPEIKKLHLRDPMLTSRGIEHIAALPQLESLQFDRGALTDTGMRSLAKLKRLRHLEVRGTAITDASMATISRLPAIKSVFLTDCNVTDRGLQFLRDCPNLAWLGLSGTHVTEASAVVLASMPSLEEVHLSRTAFKTPRERSASVGQGGNPGWPESHDAQSALRGAGVRASDSAFTPALRGGQSTMPVLAGASAPAY